MNRCDLTREFLNDVKVSLRGGKTRRKTRLWIQKWNPEISLNGRTVFFQGKPIVPEEETHDVLKRLLLEGGCPLSIEGAFNYIYPKMWGFSRRRIRDFIQSTERYQLIRPRSRNPEKARAVNARTSEGVTNFLLQQNFHPTNHLAIDLMEIPIEWTKHRFFLCVVHVASKKSWFVPLNNKEAKHVLTYFKPVLKEVETDFGEVTELSSDAGGEFKGAFDKFLEKKGINHRIGSKAFHAERKIGQFGRCYGYLRSMYKHKKALRMALQKINNVVSRITKKAPSSWTKDTAEFGIHQYRKKLRKHPRHLPPLNYKVNDRVRYGLKFQDPINVMYKSYTAFRGVDKGKRKYCNWSKDVVPIEKTRSRSGEKVYLVAEKWRKAHELQLVKNVIQLEPDKASSERVRKQRKKGKKPSVAGPKEPKFRKVKALEIDMIGWKPRRGKRERKRVNYRV